MTISHNHDEVTVTVSSAAKPATSIVPRRRSSLLLKNKSMEKKVHRHQQQQDRDNLSTTSCRRQKPNEVLHHQKEKVDWILSQLSSDEIEVAARSCYEYIKQQHSDTLPKLSSSPSSNNRETQHQRQQQRHYARPMIERYLVSKKGNTELTLQKVRKTLQFRKNFGIEELITIFDEIDDNDGDGIDINNDDDDDDVSCGGNTCSDSSSNSCNQSIPTSCRETSTTASTITGHHRKQRKEILKSHLKHQKYFVQGYDKDGRSTLYFVPRNVQGHDMEWTMKEAIYSIERAVACSKSNDKTINAIVDFSGFNLSKHSPPVDIGKEFLTTLRSHYAGQIHSIYLINTPFSFNILWKIFSPFVGSQTRNKIKFWNNGKRGHTKNSSSSPLLELYDIDQLPNWLVEGGRSNRPFDIDEYLHELSFHEAFDGRENE